MVVLSSCAWSTMSSEPGLRTPSRRAALCRAGPRPSLGQEPRQDGHTHLQHGSGRHQRSQAELRHGPWAPAGDGPQGGRSQPLRPLSTPRPCRHGWLAALETESWPRWTFSLIRTFVLRFFCLGTFFPKQRSQALLKRRTRRKRNPCHTPHTIPCVYEF